MYFGYKGNGVNIRNNDKTTDTIPCPYLFLVKILKDIKDFKLILLLISDVATGNIFQKYFDANYYGYELLRRW